jgi:NRPS condensation-like uncharacterized protein
MKSGTLNVVEKLFRSWETVHPYNAAQAAKIRGKLHSTDVEDAWRDAITALQLTPHRLNRQSSPSEGNEFDQSAPVTLQQPAVLLHEHLSAELNRSFFDEPGQWPFRPFLLSDGQHSWIGLTYRHCVADSVSIRLILRNWISRLPGNANLPPSPVNLTCDNYWKLFAAHDGSVRLGQTLSSFVRGHHRLRSAQKPASSGAADCLARVILGQAPEGMMDALRKRCRTRGVRTNDVMLAALLETARRRVPLQRRSNRHDVAVGCIVNLRPYADRNLANTFGLFLGFTNVVGSPKDFSTRLGLLKAVRRQTALQRRGGIAPACTVWVHAGLALGHFMPRRRLYHFYRKSMPLAAGLSSVRLGDEETFGSDVLDYVRVSPTGPIAPAVLSTTETDGRLSLALTYRPAIMGEDSARAILDDFVEELLGFV